jgi:8-amino-7-oxononanoate synthase
MIEWLLQKGRTYIFTTAAPPLLAAAALKALELIEHGDHLRSRLQKLVARLRAGLRFARWSLLESETAVQPLVIGGNAATVRVADALLEEGVWVPPIRPPTVPAGAARLRISLSAAHTEAHVDRLIEALRRAEATIGA